jgi:hypothetical protein
MEFQSTGMMQSPELAAEAAALQLEYEANLARIRAAEDRGEVGQLGLGLTPEEVWGKGPWGRRRRGKR